MSDERALLAWSGGKDSAWCLARLESEPGVRVVGLLTTIARGEERVPVHDLRAELVRAQARCLGLPLRLVELPWPCPNADYERALGGALDRARREGVTAIAFGDLFLEDIRTYREGLVLRHGLRPLFPLWRPAGGTAALAQRMLRAGSAATLTSLDASRLPRRLLGRTYDAELLAQLPDDVDPCGENGEFHTFCHGGPPFPRPIAFRPGRERRTDGMVSLDLRPA